MTRLASGKVILVSVLSTAGHEAADSGGEPAKITSDRAKKSLDPRIRRNRGIEPAASDAVAASAVESVPAKSTTR